MKIDKCYNCMQDLEDAAQFCPQCGYDRRKQNGADQLPTGMILNGRYMVGRALAQSSAMMTYVGWDLQAEQRVEIREVCFRTAMGRNAAAGRQIVFADQNVRQQMERRMEQILREAVSLQRMRNAAGILKCRDLFRENGTIYLVYDPVQGVSLQAYLQQHGQMTKQQLQQLFLPMLESLQAAHEAGVIHGAISSRTIFLQPDGRLTLTGFHESAVEQTNPQIDTAGLGRVLFCCSTGREAGAAQLLQETDLLPAQQGAILQAMDGKTPTVRELIRGLQTTEPITQVQPPKRKKWWIAAVSAAAAVVLAAGLTVAGFYLKDHRPYTMETEQYQVDGSYEGEWEDRAPEGTGTLTVRKAGGDYERNDVLWSENWEDGLIQGYGKWRRGNKIVYEGNFVDGLREGYGEGLTENGERQEGQWEADAFLMIEAVYDPTGYRRDAEAGDADAQFSLGVCYDNGDGVEESDEEAVKWYRLSAEQGNVKAQNNLGVCYKNGEGVEQSYEEAIKWFRLAAEQGNDKAQNSLGECYYFGRGTEIAYEEAVKWYRLSAEQGNMIAQYSVGWCCEKGEGVEQSDEEAVKWYRLSAEQGMAESQYRLGKLLYDGKGTEAHREEALHWLQKAADQGYQEAKDLLEELR